MARPSDFSAEIADAICERLIDGLSLRTICAASDMPDIRTVMRWLAAHDKFRHQYARAREIQADRMAEEILDIADTTIEGERREETEDGVKVVREDMLGHRRLQVDTRKWLMARMAPKKYGDKVVSEITGADGGPVAVVGRIERVIVRPNQKPEDADG
ncbi:terminase small subunit protein [Rhodoplanes serenus]|uniref:Terminase small subunit protein n=1 Tax=Rhodoplanes serenus TaxID=200615 RepID=A0A9X4XRT7_9BRAD|nr:terminase small subunit protein [Rhodoplanes serenus]MTW19389.1 terminase small subunit protein [Rhodoplanes serenus]